MQTDMHYYGTYAMARTIWSGEILLVCTRRRRREFVSAGTERGSDSFNNFMIFTRERAHDCYTHSESRGSR